MGAHEERAGWTEGHNFEQKIGGIREGSAGDPLGIQGGSGFRKGDPRKNSSFSWGKLRGSADTGEKLL